MDGPVFQLKGAKHITLQGLVIEGTLGNAIEILDGEGCAVVGCEIKCVGKNGVVIKGGTAHRVQSCDLHTLGHGGILLGGGVRETLTPCGHIADNNHIHHYALGKKIWSPGIACGVNDAGYACGCVVTHNLIHDSPHAAIIYGGNDHRIEFNEIHDFLIESDDLGGLYTNNGWCSYGNVLRHNFIHHTGHALGIYLDDADSGDTLEGNVMYRMGTGAAIGGGHDNILRNNVAIDCPGGFGVDARGVGRKYDQDSGMLRDYRKLNPVNPPWSTRFPSLPGLLQNNPGLPFGCVLERNVVIGTDKKAELRGKPEHFKVVTVKDNAALMLEDMRFANADKLDFRMAADAPVFKKVAGFAAIPFAKIGLYVDEHRQSLPKHISGHTTSEWHRDRSKDK
jgi:parallel beta-helix repeat protein